MAENGQTKSKTITIAGKTFDVSTPYEEGHTLTAAEAKALNQVRCENIRNNMAKAVKEGVEAGKSDAELAQEVATYDAEYVFTLASTGGRRVMDPVEKEARTLAKEAIKQKLAADGRKLKDIEKEKLEEAIATVAARDEVIKLAKQNVKRQSELASAAGGEIGV